MRVALFGVLVVIAGGSQSAAQSTSAEAEQLFRDGKKLMGEKKYAEACVAFEASYRLDASVATLANVADCREKNGQLATAWGAFLEVASQTRDDATLAGLSKTAKERAAALEPRLSYLTVSVPDESRVEGLVITRNGEALDSGLWNRAIPIDGGTYVIAGRAPAHEEWSTTVVLANDSDSATVDVPKFKEATALVELPPDPAEPVDRPAPSAFTGQRKLALGVGAAGLVGLGLGVVLGVQARGFDQDAMDLCPAVDDCDDPDRANALVDKARSRALFANISYGVGAAAVIGAAVLWFTGAPSESATVTPTVTSTSAGVAIGGRF